MNRSQAMSAIPSASSRFEQGLRLLFLFAVLAFPFTPIASSVMAGVGVLALFTPTWRRLWPRWRTQPVVWATLIFLLLMVLHLFGAAVDHAGLKRGFIRWLIFIPMLTASVLFCDLKWRRWVLRALLCTIVLAAAISALYYSGWLNAAMSHVWVSKLVQAVALKRLQERGVLYAVGAALSLSIVLLPQSTLSARQRFLLILVTGFMIISVFLQPERVGYLTLLVLTAYIFWWRFHWRGIGLALMAVLLLAAFSYFAMPRLGSSVLRDRVNQMHLELTGTHNPRTSMGIRLDGMAFAWMNIKNKPWWGHGVGAFHDGELKEGHYIKPLNPGHVENSFLLITLEMGVIGLLSFLYCYYCYWRLLNHAQPLARIQGQILLLALIVGANTFPFYHTNIGMILLYLAVMPAMAGALGEPAVSTNTEQASVDHRFSGVVS